MTKILLPAAAITVVGLLIAGGTAWAQDLNACRALTEDACRGASACSWTSPRTYSLPNGQSVTTQGFCRFKAGVAKALKAAAAK